MSDMETDRPLEIGNLRKNYAWGAKILKLPIAHVLSVMGPSPVQALHVQR